MIAQNGQKSNAINNIYKKYTVWGIHYVHTKNEIYIYLSNSKWTISEILPFFAMCF